MRFALAAALAAGALAAAPGTAAAAEGCLYQGEKVTASTQAKVERSLLCLTNLHRVRNGRTPLPLDTRLAAAARFHSQDMKNRDYFDHFSPEGQGPTGRANAFGYPDGAGENIAMNIEGTAAMLISQWKRSSGHNANMLLTNYQAIGLGVVRGCCPAGPEGSIGTQLFGVGPANTKDTGLDLYVSSERCAKAKTRLIKLRRAVKKAKKSKRAKLRRKLKGARRAVRRGCEPL